MPGLVVCRAAAVQECHSVLLGGAGCHALLQGPVPQAGRVHPRPRAQVGVLRPLQEGHVRHLSARSVATLVLYSLT